MSGCKKYYILISRSLDNDLSFDEEVDLNKHLLSCKTCRMKESEYINLKQLLKARGIIRYNPTPLKSVVSKKIFLGLTGSLGASIILLIFGLSQIFNKGTEYVNNKTNYYNAKYYPMGSFLYYNDENKVNIDENNNYSPMNVYFSLIDN